MKFTIKRVAESLLFAADIFILFLVLFENKMEFPAWLQSVGRMHPMFLHFPIVILLIAMVMEFFRFSSNYSSQEFYQNFTSGFLLLGVLSAAITVIMGLLLSKEPGYTGDTVEWHKWTGLIIVLFASLVYWCRNAKWYKTAVAKINAVAVTIILIIAGHLGAGITHGENFISTPLIANRVIEKASIDKAIIFKDVVGPVLNSKCISCHNSDKAKGRLILDNQGNILKGGKNGKLFVAGFPDSSMMIHRIQLPEEDKKHMPLTGKPQLSNDEMELLYRWIKAGADFSKKVIELPETDSLRIIAAKFLAPSGQEKYEFAEADEKTIKKLNNNYRAILPIAKESPALNVDFYNRSQFTSKALEELSAIKTQIISLNLDKMPVKDADLKTISQFENLRTLNLAFTDITGEGLSQLVTLKNLKSISLAGTKINSKNIQALQNIKTLKEIFIWKTDLNEEDIIALKNANKNIQFISGYKNEGPIPLNTPIMLTVKNVFTDTIHLFLKHPIPGVQIHYTLDGTKPDSVHAPVFNNGLVLDKTSIFQARAFKDTWLGSDSIMYIFYKSAYTPDSIRFGSPPADSYKADGAKTLINHITGDLRTGSGKWIGFQKDMHLFMQFGKPVKLSSLALHMMKNVGGDIYPPLSVEVWGGMDSTHMKLLQTVKPPAPVKGDTPSLFLVECKFSPTNVRYVKVTAEGIKKIPKWGSSPKKPGWIFTDEVLLN